MKKCNLCAWQCHVDRNEKLGMCQCGNVPKVALASRHMWEEPCISGTKGSGTIFFSGCNLKCVFCQNYQISQENYGKEISVQRLANIMIELQEKNVHNINLVSPTPYVLFIIEAIKIARKNGLILPIVYNTNSYETVDTIKMLNGYVDIYLPDLKYYDDDVAMHLSKIPHYFDVASKAILEMYHQVGKPEFDEHNIMKKGVIVRHLVLPNHLTQTKKIIEWVNQNLGENVILSIMAQYFPTYQASLYGEINRKLNHKEYQYILKMIDDRQNGYIQDLGDFEEEYVPEFNGDGI